jgi:hypothetical protein
MSFTEKEFSRLPTDVQPINYNLEFTPNLIDFTFTGKAIIDIKVGFEKKIFLKTKSHLHKSRLSF